MKKTIWIIIAILLILSLLYIWFIGLISDSLFIVLLHIIFIGLIVQFIRIYTHN